MINGNAENMLERAGEYFVRKSLFLYLLFIVSTELPTVNPMTNKLDI